MSIHNHNFIESIFKFAKGLLVPIAPKNNSSDIVSLYTDHLSSIIYLCIDYIQEFVQGLSSMKLHKQSSLFVFGIYLWHITGIFLLCLLISLAYIQHIFVGFLGLIYHNYIVILGFAKAQFVSSPFKGPPEPFTLESIHSDGFLCPGIILKF